MSIAYLYTCSDYPGMETCPGRFTAATVDEVWQHMTLHAELAHQEDPSAWSAEDVAFLKTLIREEELIS